MCVNFTVSQGFHNECNKIIGVRIRAGHAPGRDIMLQDERSSETAWMKALKYKLHAAVYTVHAENMYNVQEVFNC